jgi:hypothetical protein
MDQEKGIPIKKPKSIWAKPVKLKLKLFKSLFNTFKDAILNNWAKIPADVLDTISGIELKTSISERGWLLVTRALIDAMLKLVDEHKERIDVEAVVSDHLDEQLNEILENQEHYIEFDFFEKPKKMKLLEMIQPVYCEFLHAVGFESPMAHNICNRLAGYFVFALMDEWRKNPDYYKELEKRIKTPFDKVGQKEKEWLHYLAWIKKQVEEPVFAETFSLEQVYIPLRGYYKEKIKSDKKGDEEVFKDTIGTDKYKKIATELEKELTGWLEAAEKDDALRIITGGPGYGKSSFLKIFAARLAKTNTRVLLWKILFLENICRKIGEDQYTGVVCSFAPV